MWAVAHSDGPPGSGLPRPHALRGHSRHPSAEPAPSSPARLPLAPCGARLTLGRRTGSRELPPCCVILTPLHFLGMRTRVLPQPHSPGGFRLPCLGVCILHCFSQEAPHTAKLRTKRGSCPVLASFPTGKYGAHSGLCRNSAAGTRGLSPRSRELQTRASDTGHGVTCTRKMPAPMKEHPQLEATLDKIKGKQNSTDWWVS